MMNSCLDLLSAAADYPPLVHLPPTPRPADEAPSGTPTTGGTGSNPRPFPEVLSEIVSDPEHSSVVGWLPDGMSFAIRDQAEFQSKILPRYFRRAVFRSFARKLNRWGFRTVKKKPSGREKAFRHDCFVRDKPELRAGMYCNSNPRYYSRAPSSEEKPGAAASKRMAGAKAPESKGGVAPARPDPPAAAAVSPSHGASSAAQNRAPRVHAPPASRPYASPENGAVRKNEEELPIHYFGVAARPSPPALPPRASFAEEELPVHQPVAVPPALPSRVSSPDGAYAGGAVSPSHGASSAAPINRAPPLHAPPAFRPCTSPENGAGRKNEKELPIHYLGAAARPSPPALPPRASLAEDELPVHQPVAVPPVLPPTASFPDRGVHQHAQEVQREYREELSVRLGAAARRDPPYLPPRAGYADDGARQYYKSDGDSQYYEEGLRSLLWQEPQRENSEQLPVPLAGVAHRVPAALPPSFADGGVYHNEEELRSLLLRELRRRGHWQARQMGEEASARLEAELRWLRQERQRQTWRRAISRIVDDMSSAEVEGLLSRYAVPHLQGLGSDYSYGHADGL